MCMIYNTYGTAVMTKYHMFYSVGTGFVPYFDFFICAPIWLKFGIRGKFDVLIQNITRNLILKVDLV